MRLHEYLNAENNFLLFYFTLKYMREQGIFSHTTIIISMLLLHLLF